MRVHVPGCWNTVIVEGHKWATGIISLGTISEILVWFGSVLELLKTRRSSAVQSSPSEGVSRGSELSSVVAEFRTALPFAIFRFPRANSWYSMFTSCSQISYS